MLQQVYDSPIHVTANVDYHWRLPPVSDSISYRPTFTITSNHHTIHSYYSPLSIMHHHQHSATQHHEVGILQSPVAVFDDPPLAVSGVCSLHAHASPWAFLAHEGPVFPNATGKTAVQIFTTLPLWVELLVGHTHHSLLVLKMTQNQRGWTPNWIWKTCKYSYIYKQIFSDFIYRVTS